MSEKPQHQHLSSHTASGAPTAWPWLVDRRAADAADAVVWLHGFMGSAADLPPALLRLCPSAWVLAPDLPGHGQNARAPLEACTIDAMAEALMGELDAWRLRGLPRRVHLVGYSMGGRVALKAALNAPVRVASLVLESAWAGLDAGDLRGRRARLALDTQHAAKLRSDGLPAFLERWYQAPLFAQSLAHRPALTRALIQSRSRNDPEALARVIVAASPGRTDSRWEHLGRLIMPTCWIAGRLDPAYLERSERAAARCPNADLALIDAAGHNTHAEQPGAFAAALAAFWTQRAALPAARHLTSPTPKPTPHTPP